MLSKIHNNLRDSAPKNSTVANTDWFTSVSERKVLILLHKSHEKIKVKDYQSIFITLVSSRMVLIEAVRYVGPV